MAAMTLKDARKAVGITQTWLAGKAGVSPTLLGFAERGRYALGADQARRIADALGLSPTDVQELADAVGREGRAR